MRLSRTDVRQRTDRPTNTMVLEYTGTRLRFDEYLYGLPEGTFFYVELDEVELPEHLEALAEEACTSLEALPDAEALRRAIAEALCAGALVEAPEHLAELAEPEVEWAVYERHELERRHRIAEARVRELTRVLEGLLKARVAQLRCLGVTPKVIEVPAMSPPPLPPLMASWEAAPRPAPEVPETAGALPAPPEPVEPVVAEEDEDDEADDEERLDPRSRTVRRACVAVEMAREVEMPQRLPPGARRRLRKMPAGAYVAYGEAMDIRENLCAAMTDARNFARKDKHSTVIQWDGEWPVVARRYGQGGRTIYKVESALRRYTREHTLKTAWARFKESVAKALAEVA